MSRFYRISAWIIGIPLVLLLLFAGAIYLFSGKVKEAVVNEVNTQLAAKVHVGDIAFSLFDNFPKASIVFSDIRIEESSPVNDSALAVFKKISLTLDVWDVLRERLRIQSLVLEDGYVSAATRPDGTNNYSILKEKKETSGEDQPLTFRKVELRNAAFHLSAAGDKGSFSFPLFTCSGNFIDAVFSAHLKGEVLASFTPEKGEAFAPRKLVLDSELTVDKGKKEVRFSKTFLGLEELAFKLDGHWVYGDKQGGKVDVQTENAEIKKLLSLLPAGVKSRLSEYESTGILALKGSIQQTPGKKMQVKADFSIDNGSLYIRSFEEGLKKINLKGKVLWSEKQEFLHINNFQASLMNDAVKGVLRIDGFDDPALDIFVLSELNLENLKRVADLGAYNESRGRVFLDISLKARASELKDPKKFKDLLLNGKIKGDSLTLGNDSLGNRLSDIHTFIELKEASCFIHRLEGNWNNQRVQIRGEARDYLAYLFNDGVLNILGRAKAEKLLIESPKTTANSPGSDTTTLQLPPRIRLEAEVEVGQFTMNSFTASEITGKAIIEGDRLELRKLSFKTCGGAVVLDGHLRKRENGEQQVVVNAKLTKVNIRELFTRFNNFGQKEITDKNLNGILSGTADVGFLFDKKWNFLPASLYAFLDIRIDAGELNQYEPLKALSRFVRVEDLENIRFNSLVNQIEIRDQTIFIPSMEIKNSALNLQLEGQHTFANVMNYSIRLQLKDVWAAKYVREHETEEFEKEEQGINVFIRMSGTPDKLSIRYDSKNARKSFKQEMKKEGQSVKEILREEFGIKKKTPTEEEKPGELPNWEDDIPE